jgi:hypothetical protein
MFTLRSQDLSQVTYATDRIAQLKSAAPRTLIFSKTGQLLYSDLDQPSQTVLAIAVLADDAAPSLIISRSSNLHIKTWSPRSQQFVE